MIWHDPGFPTLFVTYDVKNDFFFSGHTGIAVLGAIELFRIGGYKWLMMGILFAIFETSTVLILQAHYTMDVLTALIAARYASILAKRAAPFYDGLLRKTSYKLS